MNKKINIEEQNTNEITDVVNDKVNSFSDDEINVVNVNDEMNIVNANSCQWESLSENQNKDNIIGNNNDTNNEDSEYKVRKDRTISLFFVNMLITICPTIALFPIVFFVLGMAIGSSDFVDNQVSFLFCIFSVISICSVLVNIIPIIMITTSDKYYKRLYTTLIIREVLVLFAIYLGLCVVQFIKILYNIF
jgi:hypothetical protein